MTKNTIYGAIGFTIGLSISGYFLKKKLEFLKKELEKKREEEDRIIQETTEELINQIHNDMAQKVDEALSGFKD